MINVHEPNWSDEIQIPKEVAVCPDCGTQLTISPDGWTEVGDGSGMHCSSFSITCEREEDEHPSWEMPYVYWLPIDIKVERWLLKNYRFVEDK